MIVPSFWYQILAVLRRSRFICEMKHKSITTHPYGSVAGTA